MKEKIYEEYGFRPGYFIYKKDYIYFEWNKTKYLIFKTFLTDFDLLNLARIVDYLDNYNIFFHQIIKARTRYFFTYGDANYVVLHPRIMINHTITLNEIISLSQIEVKAPARGSLEQKIDFLEEFLANYEKLELVNISYFIGLAENAIALLNLLNPLEKKFINHRRLHYNEKALDFYNPLNIIIDYQSRDLAEYTKSMFIAGKDQVIYNLKYLSFEDWYAYFARLIFPSFYFDLVDKYINENLKMDEKRIRELANSFEIVLKKVYTFISNRQGLPYINWLSH